MKDIYFEKYLKQKSSLPEWVSEIIEGENKDKVKFFALCDLDDNLMLTEQWIVLGTKNFYSFKKDHKEVIPMEKIKEVRELRSKVANNLSVLDKDKNILTVLWYGQRQNILFGHKVLNSYVE